MTFKIQRFIQLGAIFVLGLSCKPRQSSRTLSSDAGPIKVQNLTLNMSNTSSFAAKLEAVKNARQSIDVAYYIYQDDITGSTFTKALVDAANRGVKVRLLVDEQTVLFDKSLFQAAKKQVTSPENLKIAYFRPIRLPESLEKEQEKLITLIDRAFSLREEENTQSLFDPSKKDNFLLYFRLLANLQQSAAENGLSRDQASSIFNQIKTGFESVKSPTDAIKFIGNALGGRGLSEEEARQMLAISKRLHHKLLIVDGKHVFGGGRNMWDISNMEHEDPLRLSPVIGKTDMDLDFAVSSEDLAREARLTYDQFWDCLNRLECLYPLMEETGESRALATKKSKRTVEQEWPYVIEQAQRFQGPRAATSRYSVVFPTSPLIIKEASIQYIENKVIDGKDSEFTEVWDELITRLIQKKKGQGFSQNEDLEDHSIVLQNAYLILPPKLYEGVVRALEAGLNVTLITNAEEISDNPLISKLGRMQVEALMKYVKDKKLVGKITYIENSSAQQMHTKASIIGDTLVMGSANADPRSAFLNTENGIVIHPSSAGIEWNGRSYPSAAAAYRDILMNHTVMAHKGKIIEDRRLVQTRPVFRDVDVRMITEQFATASSTPGQPPSSADLLNYSLNSFLRSQFKSGIKDQDRRNWLLGSILVQL